MPRYYTLLLSALALVASGCACFTGQAASRALPMQAVHASEHVQRSASGHAPRHAGSALVAASPVLVSLADMNAGALASPDAAVPSQGAPLDGYRDPQRALCLACLVAGGGHFYTGETKKGATLLGIAAVGLIGGAALSDGGSDDPLDCEYNPETFECEPKSNRTPLLVGAGIAAASWIYGIIDSRRSAERVNTRNGQVAPAVEMRPILGLRRGKPDGGVSFRVIW